MTNRRLATFNVGLPTEISWDIYVDFEAGSPQFLYIAEAHCLTRTEPCWVVTGYATAALALTSMNTHIVNYVKLMPNAAFRVTCYPGEAGEIVLNVTTAAKSWQIAVMSGTAAPTSGTAGNYNNTVIAMWNAVMSY
jgi:hypothetical protein